MMSKLLLIGAAERVTEGRSAFARCSFPVVFALLFASHFNDSLQANSVQESVDDKGVAAIVPDPADDLPVAVVEEPSAADVAPTRMVNPVVVGDSSDSPAGSSMGADDLPRAIGGADFREFMENSPFTRALNLSDSLILTGVARMDGKTVATLMNMETKETYVISDVPNPQGWKMVEITGKGDLETVTAKISVAGGEVVTVRFDENRIKPGEARPASGTGSGSVRPGGGSSSGETDEERRKRYAEIREKMGKMSEDQKDKMRKIMEKRMQENPNMSREERGQVFREAMEKASGGGRDR
jgi:hypothetical protein